MPTRSGKEWFQQLVGLDIDGYEIIRFVGKGKVGYVYQARHKQLTFERALKIVPAAKISNTDEWQVELQKVGMLSTVPGVVHFHHLIDGKRLENNGHSELAIITVWDYIAPGRNLADYVSEKRGQLTVSFYVAVVREILKVLNACHVKGVRRHGDLHIGNILIGEADGADRDDLLNPREPIFVADFGHGITGGQKTPKDDYEGLAAIANAVANEIDWHKTNSQDRRTLQNLKQYFSKLLREPMQTERLTPLDLLRDILEIQRTTNPGTKQFPAETTNGKSESSEDLRVGEYQVSEMLGDRWHWWQKLFVPTVPARSQILVPDIATVVTGPRGCGKTMLFRRLSQRLVIECGPVQFITQTSVVGFYVNANDIADAFPDYPDKPSEQITKQLISYLHLCILGDVVAVLQSRAAKLGSKPSDPLVEKIATFLSSSAVNVLSANESLLDRCAALLERVKWEFLSDRTAATLNATGSLAQIGWFPDFVRFARTQCDWLGNDPIYLFIDDYTTPRISESMQRVLNRVLLKRTSEFVTKIATESATTFVPEDSSSKLLQDGDDYKLVDMGEESLFLSEEDRAKFLDEVLRRRLEADRRIPSSAYGLASLLGTNSVTKTELARQLRRDTDPVIPENYDHQSQRRGATKLSVLYHGADVFSQMWSGDTRTMIQLAQELIEEALPGDGTPLPVPIEAGKQDQVFRNRGGSWLEAHTRDLPTHQSIVDSYVRQHQFKFTGGTYGSHLKAIVESFVAAARSKLLGPVYKIGKREVPRMAFRIEITDDFRLDGLARELYSDLIRYGLFMRDARGKSVRGAMVPRLYLRRLLLPYCRLALSKRDSVPLTCVQLTSLLLKPDEFKSLFPPKLQSSNSDQLSLFGDSAGSDVDPRYNDVEERDL